MLTKLVFVLVVFTANGEANRFAEFDSMEQCQSFAQSFNATGGSNRAACLPDNIKADANEDFNRALAFMHEFMNSSNLLLERQRKDYYENSINK